MTELELKAYVFAREKHKGQLDDEGNDYFKSHIMQVGFLADRLSDDEEVTAVAFLHDTIEDADTTYDEVLKEFGRRVADMVMELTHDGKKDEYGFYFPRLKSKEAIMIKLLDRASNVSRMSAWSEERQNHYLNKTKFWKDGSDKK